MSNFQKILSFRTEARGLFEITSDLNKLITEIAPVGPGLLQLFLRHTSASLLITENYDPTVLTDTQNYFETLVLDGDPRFEHTCEGHDDMSAHIRNVFTGCSLSIPFNDQTLLLGNYQGVFLWEHRLEGRTREIVATILR